MINYLTFLPKSSKFNSKMVVSNQLVPRIMLVINLDHLLDSLQTRINLLSIDPIPQIILR